MTDNHPTATTTDAGIPVASDEHSLTVGPDGPILLQDHYLIEQMANFNRERIPERQPHAKGGGAFGHFEVTSDVSAYTKAAVFQPGTKTDTLIRFSTVAGERGSPDTWRDPRGFALKFYTSRGQLRHGRQQHAGLLRARPDEVPALHPLPEAPRRQQPARPRHAVGLLDPVPGVGAPGHLADGRPGHPAHLAAHERLLQPTPTCGSTPRARGSGSSTTSRPTRASSSSPRTRPTRWPSADTDYHQRDLYDAIERGRVPELDAEDADHAVRGGQDLPVQPVRPDQGVAARRLPADRGRPADAGPQPDRLPHRDRAGRLRAEQPGAGHRRSSPDKMLLARGVLLRRRPPRPDRASTTSRSR